MVCIDLPELYGTGRWCCQLGCRRSCGLVNSYSDAVKPGVYLESAVVNGQVRLKAIAESYDGGELSYQWYRNSTRDAWRRSH